MTKKDLKKLQLNNAGSTLVTVIVVTTFLTILATTLLYISGKNFLMKANEQKSNENFYSAETALEEIKAGLASEICSEAAREAYIDTMEMYTIASSYTRYQTFQDNYFADLKDEWDSLTTDATLTRSEMALALVSGYLDGDQTGTLTIEGDGELDLSKKDTEACVYLRGFTYSYTDADGYNTVITTDFVFTVPEMNWSVSSSYTTVKADVEDQVGVRNTYDISECVNYSNWQKK